MGHIKPMRECDIIFNSILQNHYNKMNLMYGLTKNMLAYSSKYAYYQKCPEYTLEQK